jgi:hypothetical protein
MTNKADERQSASLWVGLLTVTSAAATLALSCAMPFAALAAVAATRMPARAGFALMALAWAVSQAIGFCVLDYPRDPLTLTWAFAILTAALAGQAAARLSLVLVRAPHPAVRIGVAFGSAFIAYKLTLVAWSLGLGGFHTAVSPYYAAIQLGRQALILAGLLALYHALVALGLPAARRARAA